MLVPLCFGVMILSSIKCSRWQPEPTGYGSDFSINVTTHITVDTGFCVTVPCKFTYPPNTVTKPYRRVWFKGDPSNPLFETHTIRGEIRLENSERECSFYLDDVRKAQSDGYRFKLEWEDKQYVFSETVYITVTGVSSKPELDIPPLIENQFATPHCTSPQYCHKITPTVKWKGKAWENMIFGTGINEKHGISASTFTFFLDSTYHNTVLTCMIVYNGDIITEEHVTLFVKYAPRIEMLGSKCSLSGHLLTCVCISHGVPLPTIAWPPGLTSQNYNITTSGFDDTVTSTIITSAAILGKNDTVLCLSKNEIGQANKTLEVNYTKIGANDLSLGPGCCNLPWTLASVSVTLNGLLFLGLFLLAVAWKRSKAVKEQEETQTYTSLSRRHEPDYDTIGPQRR